MCVKIVILLCNVTKNVTLLRAQSFLRIGKSSKNQNVRSVEPTYSFIVSSGIKPPLKEKKQ